jgi:branched-chain amino acid transport system substrate-binding protein
MNTEKKNCHHWSLRFFMLLTVGLLGLIESPLLLAQPINVGRSLTLSGPLTSYGEAKRDGGDAYIEKINRAGGINGRKIELTTIDDAYDPKKMVANIRQIAADKRPAAFLGLFGVPTVAAALPVIEELRIPAVGLTSGAATLRTPYKKYVFPIRASYADEVAHLIQHIKIFSFSRVVIIHQENPFGELVRDTMVKALEDAKITVLADVKLPVNAPNADAVVDAALANKPDAMFLAMLSSGAVPVMQTIKTRGMAGMGIYTVSAVDASVVTKKLGTDGAGLGISQIVPMPSSIQLKVVSEYQEALKELGRGTPSFYGLEAFIEAKVLVAALKRAGKKASEPEAVVRALESLGDYDAGGFMVQYTDKNHRGGQFVELTIISSRGTLKN